MNKYKINLLLALMAALTFCLGTAYGGGGHFLDFDPMNGDMKSGYADVNGIKMYYEIHGTGAPLVLIHGGGSTIETSFGRLIPLISKHFTVIAMDLQAHGRTQDRDAAESFEQDADDVFALLQNLKVSRAHVLGFSNGGNTAMQLAYRHPQVVDRLVIASSFYKRDGLLPGLLDNIRNATFESMPQVFKDAFLKVNPDPKKLRSMFEKDRDRMANFKDWNDDVLRSIKASTLLISGDQDVALPAHTIAMSRLIPNCRLLILPAGHGEYIGVAEGPAPTGSMVEMTTDLIRVFLNK